MRFSVALVFALAVVRSLLTDCQANPCNNLPQPDLYPGGYLPQSDCLAQPGYPPQSGYLPQPSLLPPQVIISPSQNLYPQPCGSCLPDIDLNAPTSWAPWVSGYIGHAVLGSIPVPLDSLWPQVAACPNQNVGSLITELLELIGVQSSQWVNIIPVQIANTPFNVPSFQNYCGPSLDAYPAGAPIPLSHFSQLLSQYLAQELNYDPLCNTGLRI